MEFERAPVCTGTVIWVSVGGVSMHFLQVHFVQNHGLALMFNDCSTGQVGSSTVCDNGPENSAAEVCVLNGSSPQFVSCGLGHSASSSAQAIRFEPSDTPSHANDAAASSFLKTTIFVHGSSTNCVFDSNEIGGSGVGVLVDTDSKASFMRNTFGAPASHKNIAEKLQDLLHKPTRVALVIGLATASVSDSQCRQLTDSSPLWQEQPRTAVSALSSDAEKARVCVGPPVSGLESHRGAADANTFAGCFAGCWLHSSSCSVSNSYFYSNVIGAIAAGDASVWLQNNQLQAQEFADVASISTPSLYSLACNPVLVENIAGSAQVSTLFALSSSSTKIEAAESLTTQEDSLQTRVSKFLTSLKDHRMFVVEATLTSETTGQLWGAIVAQEMERSSVLWVNLSRCEVVRVMSSDTVGQPVKPTTLGPAALQEQERRLNNAESCGTFELRWNEFCGQTPCCVLLVNQGTLRQNVLTVEVYGVVVSCLRGLVQLESNEFKSVHDQITASAHGGDVGHGLASAPAVLQSNSDDGDEAEAEEEAAEEGTVALQHCCSTGLAWKRGTGQAHLNSFSGLDVGISLMGDARSSALLSQNMLERCCVGVLVKNSAQTAKVTGSVVSGCETGFLFEGPRVSRRVELLTGNLVQACKTGAFIGAHADPLLDGLEVTENIIGVRFQPASRGLFQSGIVRNNLTVGVSIEDASPCLGMASTSPSGLKAAASGVSDDDAEQRGQPTEVKEAAAVSSHSSDHTLQIISNKGTGLVVSGSAASPEMQSLLVQKNDVGIVFKDGCSGLLLRSKVVENAREELVVVENSRPLIGECEVSNSGLTHFAMHIVDAAPQLRECRFAHNEVGAIHILGNSDASFAQCAFSRNGVGIRFESDGDCIQLGDKVTEAQEAALPPDLPTPGVDVAVELLEVFQARQQGRGNFNLFNDNAMAIMVATEAPIHIGGCVFERNRTGIGYDHSRRGEKTLGVTVIDGNVFSGGDVAVDISEKAAGYKILCNSFVEQATCAVYLHSSLPGPMAQGTAGDSESDSNRDCTNPGKLEAPAIVLKANCFVRCPRVAVEVDCPDALLFECNTVAFNAVGISLHESQSVSTVQLCNNSFAGNGLGLFASKNRMSVENNMFERNTVGVCCTHASNSLFTGNLFGPYNHCGFLVTGPLATPIIRANTFSLGAGKVGLRCTAGARPEIVENVVVQAAGAVGISIGTDGNVRRNTFFLRTANSVKATSGSAEVDDDTEHQTSSVELARGCVGVIACGGGKSPAVKGNVFLTETGIDKANTAVTAGEALLLSLSAKEPATDASSEVSNASAHDSSASAPSEIASVSRATNSGTDHIQMHSRALKAWKELQQCRQKLDTIVSRIINGMAAVDLHTDVSKNRVSSSSDAKQHFADGATLGLSSALASLRHHPQTSLEKVQPYKTTDHSDEILDCANFNVALLWKNVNFQPAAGLRLTRSAFTGGITSLGSCVIVCSKSEAVVEHNWFNWHHSESGRLRSSSFGIGGVSSVGTEHAFVGCLVLNSKSSVRQNVVTRAFIGILIDGVEAQASISENTVSEHVYGVVCQGQAPCTVDANIIRDGHMYGVFVLDHSSADVSANNLERNLKANLAVELPCAPHVHRNMMRDSANGYGIYLKKAFPTSASQEHEVADGATLAGNRSPRSSSSRRNRGRSNASGSVESGEDPALSTTNKNLHEGSPTRKVRKAAHFDGNVLEDNGVGIFVTGDVGSQHCFLENQVKHSIRIGVNITNGACITFGAISCSSQEGNDDDEGGQFMAAGVSSVRAGLPRGQALYKKGNSIMNTRLGPGIEVSGRGTRPAIVGNVFAKNARGGLVFRLSSSADVRCNEFRQHQAENVAAAPGKNTSNNATTAASAHAYSWETFCSTDSAIRIEDPLSSTNCISSNTFVGNDVGVIVGNQFVPEDPQKKATIAIEGNFFSHCTQAAILVRGFAHPYVAQNCIEVYEGSLSSVCYGIVVDGEWYYGIFACLKNEVWSARVGGQSMCMCLVVHG